MRRGQSAYLLFTILFILLTSNNSYSQQESSPVYKFGGILEIKTYRDDYRSKTTRSDLINLYPLAPNINNLGKDLNRYSSLNASVFASRLNFSVTGLNYLNATVNTYIETDFNGESDATMYLLNLRHAYINMKWKRSSLLIGQTDHLTLVNEVIAGTIAFGAGFPYNPLNRSIQLRYSQKIFDRAEMLLAAHIYTSHNSVGPAKSQMQAGIPDIQAQIKLGNPSTIFGGFTLGAKFLRPALFGPSAEERGALYTTFNAGAFIRANLSSKLLLRSWAIYGENMTMLGHMGGYGVEYVDNQTSQINYDGIKSFSGWIDADYKITNKLKSGLFAGYQNNRGTSKALTQSTGMALKDEKLTWHSKISPRVEYNINGKFILAAEYSRIWAKWAKTLDSKLRPIESHPTVANNRIELMARVIF